MDPLPSNFMIFPYQSLKDLPPADPELGMTPNTWKQDSAEDRSQLPKTIYPHLIPVQWHISVLGVLLFEVECYFLPAPLISIQSYNKIGGQTTTKVLLYSSGNYIQYLIVTSNEKESEKEYKYIYNHFAVCLKLIQHCKLAIFH